jgi:soluble lytic murein transglycosylase-like protein
MAPTRGTSRWATWLWILPALALAHVLKGVDHPDWPRDYDATFRKYAKHYFGPGFDWRWFKAQAIAESNLNPGAKSRAGAVGLMQILPATFAEIREKNPGFQDVTKPRWNVAAGIYYDRQLYRRWADDVAADQRLAFAFASYNAGFGNVRKAYRRAAKAGKDAAEWRVVAPHTPSQTRHYVRRIRRLMGEDAG